MRLWPPGCSTLTLFGAPVRTQRIQAIGNSPACEVSGTGSETASFRLAAARPPGTEQLSTGPLRRSENEKWLNPILTGIFSSHNVALCNSGRAFPNWRLLSDDG